MESRAYSIAVGAFPGLLGAAVQNALMR